MFVPQHEQEPLEVSTSELFGSVMLLNSRTTHNSHKLRCSSSSVESIWSFFLTSPYNCFLKQREYKDWPSYINDSGTYISIHEYVVMNMNHLFATVGFSRYFGYVQFSVFCYMFISRNDIVKNKTQYMQQVNICSVH